MAHKGGLATRAYAIFEKHVLKRELCGVDVEGNKYYKMFDKNILDEARERRFMLTPTGELTGHFCKARPAPVNAQVLLQGCMILLLCRQSGCSGCASVGRMPQPSSRSTSEQCLLVRTGWQLAHGPTRPARNACAG